MQRHHVGIAGTIALIMGAVWYFVWSPVATAPTPQAGEMAENSDDAAPPGNPTIGVRMGEYGLYVPDQLPGTSVKVPLVSLGSAGFVVVVSSSNPMTVRGVSEITGEGQHDSVTIPLMSPAIHGEKLEAQLFIDDGDSVFKYAVDQPARDPLDAPITMPFEISNDVDPAPEVAI